MARITPGDANAWTDKAKLNLTALDSELETSVASQVLGRVSQIYDVSGWTDQNSTPELIKSIIAMMYVAWHFQRVYSEDTDISNYGILLMDRAEALLDGIVSGVSTIVGVTPLGGADTATVSFYPTDLSSAQTPTFDDPSLGGPRFTVGHLW